MPDKANKTILQVCFSTAWGGLEMSSAKWTRQFHNNGYNSILLTSRGAPAAKQCADWGLQSIEIDEPRDYFSLKTRRQIRGVFNETPPDAVFNHLTRDLWHLSPVLRKYPEVKLFNFARMFISGVEKNDFLHRYIYSRLTNMIALSHIQKKLLLKALPIPDEKFVVIPNAVDTERFQPRQASQEVREGLGATSEEQLLVGLIGRLDKLKGHEEFVRAAHKVSQDHPQVQFVMVGANTAFEGNEFAKSIVSLIREFDLETRVKMTDHRTDIPEILNALDIFCMPSYEENFGNVMLEALASGTACIGTNSGGTPEQISHEKTGLLVEPRSSEDLARGMVKLIEDSNFRNQIAEAGRSSALERFHLDTVFRQAEALL